MITPARRNNLIIGTVLVLAGTFIAVNMYHSMTPPTHADHDHAIASLNAGGFLWIKHVDGGKRNLVGKPGKVLVLHWFDPTAESNEEQKRAARFAAELQDDSNAEILFVARAASADGLTEWAQEIDIDPAALYFDREGRTADLCGVRRWPETIVFDPSGLLAFQAKGAARWTAAGLGAQIQNASKGVEEIH